MSPTSQGMALAPRVRVSVHLGSEDLRAELCRDVRQGLTRRPKELAPRWLYDGRGCELFEAITRLPEYYPTRREREILVARAPVVAATTGADTLVELGSGTSEKTRVLLDALSRAGTLRRFAPLDVAEETLQRAAVDIASRYPWIQVDAVVGDFEHHLHHIPSGGRRLFAFLGGTIGNLVPEARARLLHRLAQGMVAGDSLLLGTDLVKPVHRLLAAYDDSAGVTAAFNRNLLSVLNRELGAGFPEDRFEHVARYDEDNAWMEMWLRSLDARVVPIAELGMEVAFGKGEEMRTEISAKFRRDQVSTELEAAGLHPVAWWTDRGGDYALSLSFR